MKKSDINRLERSVELYRKIEVLLDKAYDNIEAGEVEWIKFHDIARTKVRTTSLVSEMLKDATTNRKWIEGKIKMIKEQL